MINLGHGKGQPNDNISPRSTKYKAYQVNKIPLNKYDKAK